MSRFLSKQCLVWLVQLLGLCLVLAWWLMRGQAHELKEPPAGQHSLLPCVSYSPFHHGDINPFNYLASVSAAQIEADLRILKTRTNCVRIYGTTQGLDLVPSVAAKLGMRVNLGVWLSRDPKLNELQLKRGLELAHQYKDIVNHLVVGNEVLLRREMTPDALAKILDEARLHSPVPVTYADVWEFWLRHEQLAKHVDVVTVHILPYWEDEPIAVPYAAAHVLSIADKVQKAFKGKPVWVGETGWPAAGRQRAGALPGRVEQAHFLRDLMAQTAQTTQANGSKLNYNFIEAFDQPWKRSFEGAMGGYWGLFDPSGQAHAAQHGSVTEDEFWWRGPLSALIAGGFGLLLALFCRLPIVATVLAFATLGAVIPVQLLAIEQWDRTLMERAVSVLIALLGSSTVILASLQMRALRSDNLVRSSTGNWTGDYLSFEHVAKASRFSLLFVAAAAALVLLLDARYRPFPWWWFIAPTFSIMALRIGARLHVPLGAHRMQLLALIIAVCAGGIAFVEGLENAQAICYCALLLMLAGVTSWPSSRLSRTNTSTDKTRATAQRSAV
jgi:exo-beta-1,3-glucanase (GH17 family)